MEDRAIRSSGRRATLRTHDADLVVVGAGVIGCAVARHAARAGARVVVIERGEPGAEASSAAAGMLSPLAEANQPGPFLSLLLQSRELFPDFAATLREETGMDVGYRDDGTLVLAFTDADEEELEARYRWQSGAGLPVERLSGAEVLSLEPSLSPGTRAALRFPGDHQVDNRKLARALWTAAARAGVEFLVGVEATAITRVAERVAGVELLGGECVHASAVVIAAGSWAGRLRGLPHPLPVHPVHGQLVALETLPPLFNHVIDSARCYLVPRSDGRVIVGATMEEDGGFRKSVTPEGVLSLLSGALEIAPALRTAPITELWSGLRPGTPDGFPILGADPDVANLLYATGHFRNGILLAPVTGETIGELALSGRSRVDLEPFGINRFRNGA
jgi:glycine oxidase